MLGLAATGRDILSTVCLIVLIWVAMVGVHDFWQPAQIFAHGPEWRLEVAHWRDDPTYEVRVWPEFPKGHWTIQLPLYPRAAWPNDRDTKDM